MASTRDSNLDKTVVFLAKRDGVDKVIKIIRYTAKLALAASEDATIIEKLSAIESTLGTSRKAYRMGKFLQNISSIRKVQLRAPFATLELIANIGECIYYFVDQFQWLVKAGVLPRQLGPRFTRISASGELLGYLASIALAVLRLHNLLEREVALLAEHQRRRRARAALGTNENDGKDEALIAEIRTIRARRALRTLGLAQDIADALLALSDLGPADAKQRGLLGNKGILAAAGLISGCISAYKNWPGVTK